MEAATSARIVAGRAVAVRPISPSAENETGHGNRRAPFFTAFVQEFLQKFGWKKT
jgi:hypothetical protein